MVSLTVFNVRFTPNWVMLLLAVFAITFFTGLGFWQLSRAAEKKQILKAQAEMSNQQPVFWQPGSPLPTAFEPLQVQGFFLPTILLLDNQHIQHQFGYNVISALFLENDTILLVDRGWVQGDLLRQKIPDVINPDGAVRLKGQAYFPSSKNMLLGAFMERKRADVAVIEFIDIKKISQFLHKTVYPFMIRLDKNEAQGFVREWVAVSMPPERHYAYALQWFTMAFVVLILFVALNLKKKYEKQT